MTVGLHGDPHYKLISLPPTRHAILSRISMSKLAVNPLLYPIEHMARLFVAFLPIKPLPPPKHVQKMRGIQRLSFSKSYTLLRDLLVVYLKNVFDNSASVKWMHMWVYMCFFVNTRHLTSACVVSPIFIYAIISAPVPD